MTIASDIQSLNPTSVVTLFQLDLTPLGSTILYFCGQRNELHTNVVWQAQTYTAIPIDVVGFELNGTGQFPRPKMRIANISGTIDVLARQYADLVGMKLTRKRTLAKYLDAVNFAAGNAFADANTHAVDDVYYVNRKLSSNRIFVEWELSSALDLSGLKLPRRQIIQNTCAWKYRSAECSYAGGAVADINDTPTTVLGSDVCGKRLTSCRMRFPQPTVLPYGGFPGSNIAN